MSPKEIDHDPRRVGGLNIFIRQYNWPDGPVGYCVFPADEEDADPLSDEDFDHMPSDNEITALPGFRTARLTADHHLHTAPEIGCAACEAIDPGTWRDRLSGDGIWWR